MYTTLYIYWHKPSYTRLSCTTCVLLVKSVCSPADRKVAKSWFYRTTAKAAKMQKLMDEGEMFCFTQQKHHRIEGKRKSFCPTCRTLSDVLYILALTNEYSCDMPSQCLYDRQTPVGWGQKGRGHVSVILSVAIAKGFVLLQKTSVVVRSIRIWGLLSHSAGE